MTHLALEAVGLTRAGRRVLEAVSADLRAGEVVGLLGPNGAGKTTLLRAALGLQAVEGRVTLGGRPIGTLDARARARLVAYIPQDRSIAWPISVRALVALGRLPYRDGAAADARAVDAALAAMDLTPLGPRPATALSGGERGRALIARALAQDAALILADEPTAGLDPAHAIALLARFRRIAAAGRGVLIALHDLGLAARSCDRILLLEGGRLVADGPPEAVLTADRLAKVYGITARIGRDATGPLVIPTGLAPPRSDPP